MTEEEIKSAIVKIEVGDGQDLETGNGFFIAPGWILTCFHILEDHPSQNIRVVGMQGEIKLEEIENNPKVIPEVDLALLEVSQKDIPHLELMKESPSSFTKGANNFAMIFFGGNSTSLTFDGIDDKGGQILIKFSMAEIKKGDSGSPVLDKTSRKVCGVMMRNRNPNQPHGGKAIRVEDIWAAFPEEMELVEVSQTKIFEFPRQEWLEKTREAKLYINKTHVLPIDCHLSLSILTPLRDSLPTDSKDFDNYRVAAFVGKTLDLLDKIIMYIKDLRNEESPQQTKKVIVELFSRLLKHISTF